MRISGNLLAPLTLIAGLVVPFEAHGAIIATVQEGNQVTIVTTFTNVNAGAETITGLFALVAIDNFAGDKADFVTGVIIPGGAAGGTCGALVGVVGGFLGGAMCTLNTVYSTPPADAGEPLDFGVSQINVGDISNLVGGGPTGTTDIFEIQVNDVPEPGSAALLSFGIAGLLGLGWGSKRR